MKKLSIVAAIAVFIAPMLASAALVQGTATAPAGSAPNMTPRFGTLIDFDDQPTGSCLASNQYAGQGIASITEAVGRSLCYFQSTQSGINYVGTGFANNWNADFLIEFGVAQAAVGIGIAGPTQMLFELLDENKNVLETYNVASTLLNDYYFINRASNDAKYLHVAGNFIAFDDLQFDTRTVHVPEPGTMALLGLSLAGLGWARRSRK